MKASCMILTMKTACSHNKKKLHQITCKSYSFKSSSRNLNSQPLHIYSRACHII